MRFRTALSCTALLVLLFTIAVWSTPLLEEENSRSLGPLKNAKNPRSST